MDLGGLSLRFEVESPAEALKKAAGEVRKLQVVADETAKAFKEEAAAATSLGKSLETVAKVADSAASSQANLAKSTQSSAQAVEQHSLIVRKWAADVRGAFDAANKFAAALRQVEQLTAAQRGQGTTFALGPVQGSRITDPQNVQMRINLARINRDLATSAKFLSTVEAGLNLEAKSVQQALEKQSKTQKEKKETTDDLSNATQGLTNSEHDLALAVVAVSHAVAALNFLKLINESTLLAGRADNLRTVLENVGALAGYTDGAISNLEQSIQKLGITTINSRHALALLAQSQIELEHGFKLARIAQDAAVIAGINSSEAFERLVIAIQRNNTWMLRRLGIMINLNQVYRNFTLETGRVAQSISGHEKQQLFLNEVLKEGAAIQGTYEAALADTYKQFTSLDRLIEEMKRELGESFQPFFEVGVTALTNFTKWFVKLSDEAKATTASLLAFSTAAAGLTVVVVALNYAFSGLHRLLQSTKGGLLGLLVLIGAGLVAALTKAAAAASLFARSLRDLAEAGSAFVDRESHIRTTIEVLDGALAKKRQGLQLTEAQQLEVNNAMKGAISLMTEYGVELGVLQNDLAGFRNRLAELVPTALQANEDLLASARTTLLHIQEQLKINTQLQQEVQKQRPTNITDVGRGDLRSTDEQLQELRQHRIGLLQQEARLSGEIAEREVTAANMRIRALQGLVDAHETAVETAERTSNKMRTQIENRWNNTIVQMLNDYKSAMDEMSKQALTEAEIEQLIADRRQVHYAAIEQDRLKAIAGLAASLTLREREAEIERHNLNAANRRQAIDEQLVKEQQAYLNGLDKIKQGLLDVVQVMQVDYTAAMEELNDQADELLLQIDGMDADLAALQIKRAAASRAREQEFNQIVLLIEETEKALNEKRAQQTEGFSDAAKRQLKESIEALELQLENFNRALKLQRLKMATEEFAAEIELRDKILALREDAAEKIEELEKRRAEITGEVMLNTLEGVREALQKHASEYEEMLDALKDRFKNVNDFIRDQIDALADRSTPGIQKLRQLFRAFTDNLREAATEDQVVRLQQLFPQALEALSDEVVEKMRETQDKLQKIQGDNFELQRKWQDEYAEGLMEGMDVQAAADRANTKLAADARELRRRELEVREEINVEIRRGNVLEQDRLKLLAQVHNLALQRRREIVEENLDRKRAAEEGEELLQKENELKREALIIVDDELEAQKQILETAKENLEVLERSVEVLKERRALQEEEARRAAPAPPPPPPAGGMFAVRDDRGGALEELFAADPFAGGPAQPFQMPQIPMGGREARRQAWLQAKEARRAAFQQRRADARARRDANRVFDAGEWAQDMLQGLGGVLPGGIDGAVDAVARPERARMGPRFKFRGPEGVGGMREQAAADLREQQRQEGLWRRVRERSRQWIQEQRQKRIEDIRSRSGLLDLYNKQLEGQPPLDFELLEPSPLQRSGLLDAPGRGQRRGSSIGDAQGQMGDAIQRSQEESLDASEQLATGFKEIAKGTLKTAEQAQALSEEIKREASAFRSAFASRGLA